NLVQPGDRMQRNERCRVRLRIKSDDGAIRNESIRAVASQSHFTATSATDKAWAGKVSQRLAQLSLSMAHDNDDALRQRSGIVSSSTAVKVTDLLGFILQ